MLSLLIMCSKLVGNSSFMQSNNNICIVLIIARQSFNNIVDCACLVYLQLGVFVKNTVVA